MDEVLAAELARTGGLIVVRRLPPAHRRWAIFNAVRSGRLVRVHPGVYAETGATVDPLAAAAAYVDDRGAFSHTTALALWDLRPLTAAEPVHVTTDSATRSGGSPSLVVHRRVGFAMEPPHVRNRDGHWVTPVEDALADAWPLVAAPERISHVLNAVSERMTTPSRIGEALAHRPHFGGGRQLIQLLERLSQGCHSHLEIFGAETVFTGSGMPDFVRQAAVRVGGRVYYLDVYAEREKVDFELDGTTWHSGALREQDLRRDAALATKGILVVRFTYRRLTREPGRVRREILEILQARR